MSKNGIINQFFRFNKILLNSIFISDTMQEYCLRERYDFSRWYLNKFLVISKNMCFSVFSSSMDDFLLSYFSDLGLVKNNFLKISGEGSLHDCIMKNRDFLSKLESVDCKYLFAYKTGLMTEKIGQRIKKIPLSLYKNVEYLSDKKNLYHIFPKDSLPFLYRSNDIKDLNLKLVVKPKLGANSRGIFMGRSNDIINVIKNMRIKYKDILLQEYVEGKICHSVTFINFNDSIEILYAAQQIIEKNELQNNCFGFVVGNAFISSGDRLQYSVYYEKILSFVRSKKQYFSGVFVFLIEFIVDKNGSIKIMEINPRIGSSMPMANFLYSHSFICNSDRFFLSNKTYKTNNPYCFLDELSNKGLLFSGKNVPSVLPLNISKEYGLSDVIIICSDKEESIKLSSYLDLITKKSNETLKS